MYTLYSYDSNNAWRLLHAFQESLEAIDRLQDLVTLNESVEAAVVVYLLGDILNDFNSTSMTDQERLIEV